MNERGDRPHRTPGPGDTPLADVVDTLDRDGWDGAFRVHAGAEVECLTCRTRTAATALAADEVTRLEGASDPADMALVLPVRCPNCGTRGSLVLAYGPNASAEEADVLAALDRHHPAEGDLSRPATPGMEPGLPLRTAHQEGPTA